MKLKPSDQWFSKCVRHAANWTCEKCGKVFPDGPNYGKAGGLDCSHHHGRAKKSVRWAKENAAALCVKCHMDWHSHPTEGSKWLEEYIGKGAMELLAEKANQTVKVSKVEEKEIAAHYKKEYNRMVEENSREFTSWG